MRFLLLFLYLELIEARNISRKTRQSEIAIERCYFTSKSACLNSEVTFFLYTLYNQDEGIQILPGKDLNSSNLLQTYFNPLVPSKILIHGYNSDMFLGVMKEVRSQYFISQNVNVFLIEWSKLAKGPCYPAAVWNCRIAGECTAQLVQRIYEASSHKNIHLIGFSLGAHVAAYIANYFHPLKINRITGLDPALPGFATVGTENKLDATDADFVDIIHTNAFLQGEFQEIGHVDYYLNGGMVQPGCWAQERFLPCNHHRSVIYFAESINTRVGFWGWPCPSYYHFLFGRCLPKEPQILMGEHANTRSRGVHLVITNSVSPFAVGKYLAPLIEVYEAPMYLKHAKKSNRKRILK